MNAGVLARYLPPRGRALVLGAPNAAVAVDLALLGHRCAVVDPDPLALIDAAGDDPRIGRIAGVPAQLAIGGRAVDLIFAGALVSELPRRQLAAAIRRWADHLESDGHLIAAFDSVALPGRPPADALGWDEYDRACHAADLAYAARYRDLTGASFDGTPGPVVSVHRKR